MFSIDKVLAYIFALAAVTPQAPTKTSLANSSELSYDHQLVEKEKFVPQGIITSQITQGPDGPQQPGVLHCGQTTGCPCGCTSIGTSITCQLCAEAEAVKTPEAVQRDIMDTSATKTSDLVVTTAVHGHLVDEL